jgi:hypothetical protein
VTFQTELDMNSLRSRVERLEMPGSASGVVCLVMRPDATPAEQERVRHQIATLRDAGRLVYIANLASPAEQPALRGR